MQRNSHHLQLVFNTDLYMKMQLPDKIIIAFHFLKQVANVHSPLKVITKAITSNVSTLIVQRLCSLDTDKKSRHGTGCFMFKQNYAFFISYFFTWFQ